MKFFIHPSCKICLLLHYSFILIFKKFYQYIPCQTNSKLIFVCMWRKKRKKKKRERWNNIYQPKINNSMWIGLLKQVYDLVCVRFFFFFEKKWSYLISETSAYKNFVCMDVSAREDLFGFAYELRWAKLTVFGLFLA